MTRTSVPSRVDANQPAIVKRLRKLGATVQTLHELGKGAPDLLVGYRGRNVLLEVKDENKPKSKRKLTPDEQKWHDRWKGQVAIVESEFEACKAVGMFEDGKGTR